MRLIDADNQDLQEAIGRMAFRDRQDIRDLIDTQPIVDAELVTRCRNCYNAITIDCVLYCAHWRMNTFDDGYCHEGVLI